MLHMPSQTQDHQRQTSKPIDNRKAWDMAFHPAFLLQAALSDKSRKRGHRVGSEAAIIAKQQQARNIICQGGGRCKKLLGVTSKKLDRSSCWSPQFAKVRKLADKRAVERGALARLTVAALRPGQIWTRRGQQDAQHPEGLKRRWLVSTKIRVALGCQSVSPNPKKGAVTSFFTFLEVRSESHCQSA